MTLGQTFGSVIEAAKLGSDWAWAALYRDIAGPVTGFFRARGIAEPEDAAGDVFFALSRDIDRFNGDEEDFRTVVFGIAYDRLKLENRFRTSRSALSDTVLNRLQRDVAVIQHVETTDVPDDVRRAFEALTPPQRDVLSLRIVAGLTLEQTATVVDRGVDAVRTLQRRALTKVRGLVGAEGVL